MHRGSTTVAAALLLAGACLAATAWAQQSATPAVIPPARPERFLGLDVFAGGAGYERYDFVRTGDPSKDDQFGKIGWDAGATVSVGVRWLGITGAFGRQTIETVPTWQVAVGPRLTSPWLPLGEIPVRAFVHALVGLAATSGVTPSQSSAEWVIGGGVDIVLLRMQFDSVRLNMNGLKPSSYRFFVGGVVPLCLRGCRESDGFNVSGRPAWK
jgi:hypothetical protein